MNTYRMNQYQENQISTASSEQILLMLYDGAIRFTRRAITGVEENKPELRLSGVSKAMAIVTEFSNSLNREIGGKIAEDLDALYDFMIRELTAANINNDLEKLKTVEKLLVDLRQTWGEAVEINKRENAAKTPAANTSYQAAISQQVAAVTNTPDPPQQQPPPQAPPSPPQTGNGYPGTPGTPGTYKPFSISR